MLAYRGGVVSRLATSRSLPADCTIRVPKLSFIALASSDLFMTRRTGSVSLGTISCCKVNEVSVSVTTGSCKMNASRVILVFSVLALLALTDSTIAAFQYAVTDLGTFGGTLSFAHGINDRGQVVGDAWTGGDAAYHAYRYDGTMNDLGTLGGSYSQANAINNNGQIVGFSYLAG